MSVLRRLRVAGDDDEKLRTLPFDEEGHRVARRRADPMGHLLPIAHGRTVHAQDPIARADSRFLGGAVEDGLPDHRRDVGLESFDHGGSVNEIFGLRVKVGEKVVPSYVPP